MKRSEEALSAVLVGMDACVLERLEDGRFELHGAAPKWLAALGLERAQSINLAERFPFLEGFLPDAGEAWDGSRNEASSGQWTQELPPTGAGDEEPCELVLEARALRGPNGEALLLLQRSTGRYEEKRRILQRARAALLDYEHLRKEVDRKELLLHCIVHDLRGPLAGMVGTMSLVKSNRISGEKAIELLELGLEQARYQESMIHSILEAFAAEVRDLESFETTPDEAPDLDRSIEAVMRRYQSAYDANEVALELQRSAALEAPLPVIGRTDRLERVLENLLENALRFAPPGSRVCIGVEPDGKEVAVTIADEGPGVPAELQSRLFEKFAQSGRSKGVAGLGLYFCRSTLELWGGGIAYVPRAEKKGACFRLHLRRARA